VTEVAGERLARELRDCARQLDAGWPAADDHEIAPGDRLRTVMASFMRWRRGLIVAIWSSCLEEGCDQEASAQLSSRASTPAQRVR
jgi:hypothetical protein